MTDNETMPQCRAQLHFSEYRDDGPFRCVLPENHGGPHRDADRDTWDITYVDEPAAKPFHLTVRPVQEQLTALTVRVGLLEASRTYLAPEDERDGNYLHGRTHDDLIKELYQRISKLEGAWTAGGETLEERLARNVLGMQERHRSVVGDVGELRKLSMALREDATRLHTRITKLENVLETGHRLAGLKSMEHGERLSALEAEAAEHDRGASEHVCGPAC